MLRSLTLHNVGPAQDLALDPIAPRLNVLTGDNGLGKSFILEAAWWALTRTWHTPAVPTKSDAELGHTFDGSSKEVEGHTKWSPRDQKWKRKQGKPANPGLVLYARADGSFSVWDPARNYRLYTQRDGSDAKSPAAYQFTPNAVLDGLKRKVDEGGVRIEETLCAGLNSDWALWQLSGDPALELLESVLQHFGLTKGDLAQPKIDDVRRMPTIRMPYGQDVPLTYAPAGVKRIAKLAYLLTWALTEHHRASQMRDLDETRQVILLIDELETHLHPGWQRRILPSLMRAISSWRPDDPPEVQYLVTTHSPLILTSLESIFDKDKDVLWKLDLSDGEVSIERDWV